MAESGTVDPPHTRRHGPLHLMAGASPTVEVALVDMAGVIVAVNGAWAAFGAANGADPDRSGVGVSYLDLCDGASADRYAAQVASALRTALDGELPAPARVALPCHAPGASRWFDVLVSSRFDDSGACIGATVTLSPASPPRAALPQRAAAPGLPVQGPAVPAFYVERSERLGDVFAQLLLDRAPLGILVVDDQETVVRAGRAAEQLFGYGTDGLTGTPISQVLPDLDPVGAMPGPGALMAGTTGAARTVDGVRADGSTVTVEVRIGSLPLSRGTGVVVLVHAGAPDDMSYPSDRLVYCDHEIDDILAGLDQVIGQMITSGLTVTGAAAARMDDRSLATTLIGVTEDLDHAVRGLRRVAQRLRQRGRRPPFTRAGDTGATGDRRD